MTPLIKAILFGIVGQVLTFLQFQGGLKFGWTNKYPWVLALGGIPISYVFMMSVKYFVEAFNGQIWPSRIIGFSIGIFVFTIMSYFLFKEPVSLKTFTCLCLGACIVLLQIYWK